MKNNQNYFQRSKTIPIDKFFYNVLYDKKNGYYSSKLPFGSSGDFITAPGISNLFSEMVGIWIISTWKTLGKPKNFNIVELGPGDGSLTKVILNIFKKFNEFNNSFNIFLYEKSKILKNLQKKNIKDSRVKWTRNFTNIKKGPVIFFGNEFFDAIPIKQFYRRNNLILEKYYFLGKDNKINTIFKKTSAKNIFKINKFKSLNKLKFIEFPKLGFDELKKITKKISQLNGGILLIDYGYLKSRNKNTLQSLMNHKKNDLLSNLGNADITSLVNFNLIKNYIKKKDLKVNNIVSQGFFLKRMGIMNRAEMIAKRMNFKEKSDLYYRIQRLIDPKQMGELFKFFSAFKLKKKFSLGFN